MSVRIEKNGSVLTVILDRPGVRNAVDRETAEALYQAFLAFDADESLSVAVLWGAGGCFCAGADLQAIAKGEPNLLEPGGVGSQGPMGPSRLLLSKPVIAAIEGYAVAGGLELAAWCDLRVAGAGERLGVLCRRWGVPLIDGGTVRIPALVGLSRALDLILTGREIGAEEALSMGLVNRVVPDGEARAAAEELAGQLAGVPQGAMRADRLSAIRAAERLSEGLVEEFERGMGVIGEVRGGAERFSNRRAKRAEGAEGAKRG
jgi:enoyl-CoA hydratase